MSHPAVVMAAPGSVPAHGRAPVPVVLAVAGVLAQVAYPLLSGTGLRLATAASVVLLSAAAVAHAAYSWGWRAAGAVVVGAGGSGLLAEALGVRTGFPFGTYSYAESLGPQVLGVPLLVPLAWIMMGYPCLLLGRALAARSRVAGRAAVSLFGGAALASWDLFLDPQMVAEGHWAWQFPDPGLPGVPGVPLTNYAGWLLVGVLMIAVLDRLLPRRAVPSEVVPAAVLAWTWAGSVIGNLVFFGRPWVALYGGVAMGALVLPYLRGVYRGRRPR